MRIQNNMMAMNTYRQYNIANNATAGYAEKLSSGYQINRAGDDAAGLAISEKMRAQIRGLNMASKNSLDAVSLIQTAEGALQSTHDILQRMRELAVQSASDTNEQVIDRGALDQEFQALKKEIDDTARTTRFNDQNLIDGTFQEAFYSTNIDKSKLTDQTIADVSRVGVKSNHNMDGSYKINVEYIAAVETKYARASYVDMLVSDTDKRIKIASEDAKSIISTIDFQAVKDDDFNGKTFEIWASGSGTDWKSDTNGLQISLYDKSTQTTYKGVISATDTMEAGSVITVAFDGLGEMKFDIKTDIAPTEKQINKISEALNNKEIKFVKSTEVITSTGLGREGAHTGPAGTTRYVPIGASVATGGDPTKAGSISVGTKGTLTDVAPNGKALDTWTGDDPVYTLADGITTVAATITYTKSDGATALQLTNSGDFDDGFDTATGKILVDLGDYGTYEIEMSGLDDITSSTEFAEYVNGLLNNFSVDIEAIKPAPYEITSRFDAADAASKRAANTTLDISGMSVVVDSDGEVTSTPAELLAGVDLIDNKTGAGRLPDLSSGDVTLEKKFGTNSADELVYELTIKDYGTFTINVGAQEYRSDTELSAQLADAINKIGQTLGDVNEGQDNVKGHDAQIALTLNGEMIVVEQNDSSATFNSTGIALEFRPLDFSTVKDSASATKQFTEKNGTSIDIYVTESEGKALTIQTGANQGDELQINIDAMNTQLLGIRNSDISTQKTASSAITLVNNAINQVSTQRAALGALQNRLNFKIANLDTSAENLQAAESRIRDTDMAKVMTSFTKSNILGQAATAMLAQANSQPQNVLQLLR